MLDKMIIGRYVPSDSVMHKMDPRAKLLLVFLFVCVVFLANNVDVTSIILNVKKLALKI